MNAPVRVQGVTHDSEIAEYLATCTSTPATPETTMLGTLLCEAMLEAIVDGDATSFDAALARVQQWTGDWFDVLSAAQHAACLGEFESAGRLNQRIQAVSQLAERALSVVVLRPYGAKRSARTYSAV